MPFSNMVIQMEFLPAQIYRTSDGTISPGMSGTLNYMLALTYTIHHG